MKYKVKITIILLFISCLLVATISTANTIDNETYFHVENEIYSANTTMIFEVIAVDITYFTFNDSNFFLSSIDNINITYDFIRYKIPTAAKNEKVMSFYINTTSAVSSFRISGFQPNMRYGVYKDGILIRRPVSTSTGYILFSNAGWGTPPPYIEIYEIAGETITAVGYEMSWIPFLSLLALGFVFWKEGIIVFKRKKKKYDI